MKTERAEEKAVISQIQTVDSLYNITLANFIASVAEFNCSCGLTANIQA